MRELAPPLLSTMVGNPCVTRQGGSKQRGDSSSRGLFNPGGGGGGKEGSLPGRGHPRRPTVVKALASGYFSAREE